MPIYDYVCGACSTTTEVVHGIHEDGPLFCPACGAKGRMKKAFTLPTIVFKGSGWAKKDRSSTSTTTRASRASSGEKADQVGEKAERSAEKAERAGQKGDKKESDGSSSTSSTAASADAAATRKAQDP